MQRALKPSAARPALAANVLDGVVDRASMRREGRIVSSSDRANGEDVLHLGCGRQHLRTSPAQRVVRVDRVPDTAPDVVWDLNDTPYPFENDSFDRIDCTDVLEHVDDLVQTMEEIHRIGRHGALVHVATPHFSSANSFRDPTHRHHLSVFSFDYFTGENEWDFYTRARFVKRRAQIIFAPSPVNSVVSRVARRWPDWYERRLAWILPAWFISIELEIRKEAR